jgi:hypothetical protein
VLLFISYTNLEQNYLQIFIPIAIGLTPLPTNQFLTFIQNVYLCKESKKIKVLTRLVCLTNYFKDYETISNNTI